MYSESDIDGAVAAGAITREAAAALRNHIAVSQSAPAVDEEHFRLLTGFNDIFVSIAVGLVLVAVAWIGKSVTTPLAGGLVAVVSWGLAEYFTRQRRMALPSIILLLAFTGGVAAALVGALVELDPEFTDRTNAIVGAGIGLVTAGAAWLHWKRFMVPITVTISIRSCSPAAFWSSPSPCGGTCPTANAAHAARMSPSGCTSPPRR